MQATSAQETTKTAAVMPAKVVGRRARVIHNPSSGGRVWDPGRLREQLPELDLDWVETRGSGDATKAAEEWDDGLLMVAGGDGTVNEVVNGLGNNGFPEGVTLAVGNCRYAGGGWLAAPRANPEDGLLDVVVVKDVGLAEVLALAPAALAGSDYLDKGSIHFALARKVRISTRPPGPRSRWTVRPSATSPPSSRSCRAH